MKHMRAKIFYGILLTLLLFLLPSSCMAATESESVIRDGVYVQDLDLGGMNRREALRAINEYFQKIADSSFTIRCMDGRREIVKVSDWSFSWDASETVDYALQLGSEGSLIARYKSEMNLKYGTICLDVPYSISSSAVLTTLEEEVSEHDSPAVNAQMTREDGEFVVTAEAEPGEVTDEDATLNQILDEFAGDLSEHMTVDVVTKEEEPTITAEDLALIKDPLGYYQTDYSSSSSNRKTNIRVATEYLDGTVVMPGESLSVSEAIQERTEENGYMIAAQYSNGETEEDIGGGVCQVSTTIYNALIRAELQIDERHNHSMVVSYVPYGTDAAIATGSKDLVFTNDSSYPIYIQGEADGSDLSFTIYGVETRAANREIKFEAETVSEEWPTDRTTKYSSDYASGTTQITGTARPEVTATLTKVVYINGEETERILMHTDYYAASRQSVTYGTG